MKTKLNCIILIDDNAATNFFHKVIIDKANCAEQCIAFQSGQEALSYLKNLENRDFIKPDLIFLDINMPGMDGWQFLEHYNNLEKNQQAKVVVVMLTTSLNPADREKAKTMNLVYGFLNKPLTKEMVFDQIKLHFPEKLN